MVLSSDLVEGPLPQVTGEREHVGLVHQGQVVAGPPLGQVVCEAHAPLGAEARVDGALRRHLQGSAAAEEAPLTRVGPLGVLPGDDEVERAPAGSREARERPQVDVEVELEAHPKEQPPLQRARRHVATAHRRSDGAEEDGVQAPQLGQHAVGQGLPGA